MSIRQNLPHVLFLHGLGDDATAWDCVRHEPILTPISRTAVSLPGFGGEPWVPQGLPELADDLCRRIAGMDKQVVVVGHSMGGAIATLAAHDGPRNLVGIVNVGGNLTDDDCFFSQRIIDADRPEDWIERYRDKHPGRYADALGRCDPKALYACAAELVKWSGADELTSRYDAVEIPKLFVYGTVDTSVRAEEWLHETHQNTVRLEGVGHMLMDEQPELFATVLMGWILDLPQPVGPQPADRLA